LFVILKKNYQKKRKKKGKKEKKKAFSCVEDIPTGERHNKKRKCAGSLTA
jgi:hypothetical protein